MTTDKMVRIRNTEREKIIPPFDNGRIFLVSIDEESILRENFPEYYSASIDPTSCRSRESDGYFHRGVFFRRIYSNINYKIYLELKI